MPEPTVDNQSRVQPTAPPQATVINCKQKAGVPLDAKKGQAAFVSGMNRFGFDYYRAVTDGEGKSANLIYSPYSISTAFSMVYAGACSNTETQIAKVLGFLPQASHHAASETLQRRLDELAFRPVANQRTGNLPFQLRDANAVWGRTGYPFADAYQRVLAEHYGSRVRPVDFISDVEGGRKLVNDWMWKETEQHIKDILPEGS
ncbi:MAG: serpin family protein, partial [Chloroflexia bacterium]